MRPLRDPIVQAAHVLVSERVKALAAGEPGALGPALDALNFFNSLVQPRPMPPWFQGVIEGGKELSNG